MAKTDFKSIDEYIAACPEQSQTYLRAIRKLVKTLVPDAREKISYQIACFELDGRNLIHFAGWARHVSLYPLPAGDAAFQRLVAPYLGGKGTLKFPLSEALPSAVIEKVVRAHLAARVKKTVTKGKAK